MSREFTPGSVAEGTAALSFGAHEDDFEALSRRIRFPTAKASGTVSGAAAIRGALGPA